jgi:hypothetical protein
MRRLAALLLVSVLAGCGGGGEERGEATLWVTRDRGTTVMYTGSVSAGQTVMDALRSAQDVETRYGGRFVQSIDGVEGSLSAGRDWFYFVNGFAADRSAAEYRLRAGEVAWWDYRSWKDEPEVQVVVGAFPEPFVHGYAGKVRPAAVRYARAEQAPAARAVAKLIGARTVSRAAPACCPNVFRIVDGPKRFEATATSPGGPVTFVFAGDVQALVANPRRFRFRYEVKP